MKPDEITLPRSSRCPSIVLIETDPGFGEQAHHQPPTFTQQLNGVTIISPDHDHLVVGSQNVGPGNHLVLVDEGGTILRPEIER